MFSLILDCLAVGAGGAVGAISRFLLGLVPIKPENGFPIITLFINVLGAFLITVIAVSATKNASLSSRAILFLKVGICGGFTTFSTFSLESFQLLQKGNYSVGISYMALSLILCVGTCALTYKLMTA